MSETRFRPPPAPFATALVACAILGGCTPLSPFDVSVPSTDEQVAAEAEAAEMKEAAIPSDDSVAVERTTTPAADPAPRGTRLGGSSSVTGVPEPLVFIDGVRVEGREPLADLRPEHVERIEVTKGRKALERFGPEAVVGTIEIFLKEEYRRSAG